MSSPQTGGRSVSQIEVEGSTPQYEGTFDDYLEMFIQFGYVTLFSSAYPLAGLCALLNNLIEIRSDAFKLCYIYQRPFPQRVESIGSWQTAMEVTSPHLPSSHLICQNLQYWPILAKICQMIPYYQPKSF